MSRSAVRFVGFAFAALSLAGCGVATRPAQNVAALHGMAGAVHGGQQPVSGATIQLYTVGITGDGSASTALLQQTVSTDANGNFSLAGAFSCSGATQVYIVATGGNPGVGAMNPNLAMMTALGPCTGITASTFISINELTTVAAVAALYPYMSSVTAIGSGSGDASALGSAFTLATALVDPSAGTAPGNAIPAGMGVPVAEINTLADDLAACINSKGGSTNDGSSCGTLFSLTTPSAGTAPTDTITALMNLEKNPTLNTTPLTNFPMASSPYQPTLTTPPPNYSVNLAPAAVVSATASVTFGDTPLGSPSAAMYATLLNTTAAAVTISSVGVAGANPGDFEVQNGCQTVLAKGAGCSVALTFVPSGLGAREATLLFTVNGTAASTALSGNGVPASTGPVTLSPASLNFVVPNVPQTVTLSNYGTATLGISAIHLSSSNFTQTSDCGAALSGQSVCHVYVSAVNTPGSSTGALTVVDTDTTDAQTVSLSGTIPYFSEQLSWGVGALGQNGLTMSFYGGVFVETIDGMNVYDFGGNVTELQGGDWSIEECYARGEPGSCYATGTFNAVQPGPSYGLASFFQGANQLWIGYGAQTTPAFFFEKTINSDQPISSYSFGSLTRGTSVQATFNVANASTLPLTLNAPVFTTLGGNLPGEFTASTCTSLVGIVANSSVEPGTSCLLTVTFNPQAIGTRTATMTLTDSTGVSQSIQFTGFGQYNAPGSPANAAFGNVAIGTAGTQNVSVIVPYSHPLLAAIGANGSQAFTLPGVAYCSGTTSPCAIPVAFTPTTAATLTGSLLITDPVSGVTSTTMLTGTGYNATTYTVSPESLSFSPRSVGTTSLPQTITVTNTGTYALTFTSVGVSGGNSSDYAQSNNCFPSLPAGSFCTISVTNTPTATGPSSSSIVITTVSPTSPQTVTLSGSGT